MFTKSCSAASLMNLASNSSLPVTKGTFIKERYSGTTVPLNNLDWSKKSYKIFAFSHLVPSF